MTQDEIIEMAIKAELNLYVHDLTEKQYIQVIEAFAKLVAAAEREACAKVCDIPSDWEDSDLICGAQGRQLCNDLARSIRARGGEA